MKNITKKIAAILQMVFGYGILICLFAGGATFFGYVAALWIGGETAATICTFIYKNVLSVIVKASNILVLLGLLIMYLKGETSLTITPKHKNV